MSRATSSRSCLWPGPQAWTSRTFASCTATSSKVCPTACGRTANIGPAPSAVSTGPEMSTAHPSTLRTSLRSGDKYPQDKYQSSFETVAAIAYRGHDVDSLREASRRIAFSVVVGNGDAHLKNRSLICRDRRVPNGYGSPHSTGLNVPWTVVSVRAMPGCERRLRRPSSGPASTGRSSRNTSRTTRACVPRSGHGSPIPRGVCSTAPDDDRTARPSSRADARTAQLPLAVLKARWWPGPDGQAVPQNIAAAWPRTFAASMAGTPQSLTVWRGTITASWEAIFRLLGRP